MLILILFYSFLFLFILILPINSSFSKFQIENSLNTIYPLLSKLNNTLFLFTSSGHNYIISKDESTNEFILSQINDELQNIIFVDAYSDIPQKFNDTSFVNRGEEKYYYQLKIK